MSPERAWSSHSRTLAVRLLAVVVPPAIMLVWLGLALLQQDRSLLAERERERLGAALQGAVHALDALVVDAERRLPDGAVPEGCVRLGFGPAGSTAEPGRGVAWLPSPPSPPPVVTASLAAPEELEFRGSPALALAGYRRAAGSHDETVRAGALLGEARVLRRQRRWDDAVAVYRRLAGIRGAAVAGAPADLQARRAICGVLAESGRTADLAREAAALAADLRDGRWALDRPAWELTASDLEVWAGRPPAVAADRLLMSDVASALWYDRQRGAWPADAASGRRVVVAGAEAVTVIWRHQGADTAALAIPPAALRAWAAHAIAGAGAGMRLAVLAPDGRLLDGAAPAPGAAAARALPADSGLPWTLVLRSDGESPLTAELAARRRLLSIGLAAILMFVVGGSYLLWRVIHRELAVVRQQREFVSTVSHEFRTPLTALRHVTELLQESDDMPADRRRAFYDALGRSTARLRRLVESLLDFSRMESGKKPYDLRPLDAGELARQVAADFQHEAGPRGVTVRPAVDEEGPLRTRADRDALTHAIWNLLDNALKYSPGARAIDLSVSRRDGKVVVSVRDQGLGISAGERREIFDRFVRGAQARRRGIEGTGLGLAIVSHIVSAHGGSIELESEEGRGSTFSIVLPSCRGSGLGVRDSGSGPTRGSAPTGSV